MTSGSPAARRVLAPRFRALGFSAALHGALLAAAAALPAGALVLPSQDGSAPADSVAVESAWSSRPCVPEEIVVARAPSPVSAAPARVEAEPIVWDPQIPAYAAPDDLDAPATEPGLDPAPDFAAPSLAWSLRPGRGGADADAVTAPDAGVGAGAGEGPLAGSIGVGGGSRWGGLPGGGGPGSGTGGGVRGQGLGEGSDGPGSGLAARGATRAPSLLGALDPPPYPAGARTRGWQGRVILLVHVDARGRVEEVEVLESSGRTSLDDAACEGARAWRFAPALRDGEAVAGCLRVPVRFQLVD